MDFRLILLLVACTISFYVTSASNPPLKWRLPRHLNPHHYELFMWPNFYRGRDFVGKVFIHMTVEKQTKFIVVHAQKLNIFITKVFENKTMQLTVERYFANETYNYWVVETRELMTMGAQIKLELAFTGQFGHWKGIYKNGYYNETTREFHPMVATNFRPSYTRLAFPNFDEPFFKSTFTIKLRHWANYTAVSNMPEQNSSIIERIWQETLFKKTPPMNSFSVSFVISNLPYRNNTLPGGNPYRLWARSDRLGEADFALNMTPVIQHYLYKALPLHYPPEKLDQFVMPRSSDSMSWGLITCAEKQLFFDPIRDGERQRQYNFANLTLQLAYNYVANLVSCRNWDHIWLKLGLVTFYRYKSAWAADPTVYLEEKDIELSLAEDATIHSRPLVNYTTTSMDPTKDLLSMMYYKGAALLKMMESFLGVRRLRRSIRRFIKNNTHRTVVTQDLWDSIQEEIEADVNISEIMRTWIHSMGFPVINIQTLSGNKINATQKRFLLDSRKDPNYPPSKHGYKWYVPLPYQTKGGNFGLVWMNQTDAVFDNLLSAEDDWILFSHDQSGYYRVNYEAVLWDRLIKQLTDNHTVFNVKQRSKLLIDAATLANAEQLGYEVVLGLTVYVRRERSLQPWLYVWYELLRISRRLFGSPESFENYHLNLTSDIMDELQIIDEGSNDDKLLRPLIITLACASGHVGCRENLTRLFEAWIQNETNVVPKNFRNQVHCFGMFFSLFESSTAWNTTLERYIIAKSEEKRTDLLVALTCIVDQEQLDKLMDIYISNISWKFPHDDFKYAAEHFTKQPAHCPNLWQWLKVHHREVINRYTKPVFVEIVLKIADTFDTTAKRDEVTEFLSRLENAERQKKRFEKRGFFPPDFIPDVRRRINYNIRWLERNKATIINWLQQNT